MIRAFRTEHRLAAAVCGLLIALAGAARARAADCAALAHRAIDGATIASAELVPAGPMSVPAQAWGAPPVSVDLPAFCRVKGVAGPSVGFEVWLPLDWNGRLLSVGNGGFGGSVRPDAMADGLKAAYAVTGNDTGHAGESRAWMGDEAAVREWGHGATHLATGPAKAIVAAFYGAPARYAYFTGCSTGGAQAMEEAEFYPDDYDGIIAGAPGMAYAHLMLSFLWGLKAASAHPDGVIGPDKLRLLHRAVLDACGDAEERARGVLDDPLACRFDPARLACKAGEAADCLTPGQVATAEALYQGPRNPRTGAQIYPGFARGSEFDPTAASPLAGGWVGIQGPLAQIFAIPLLRDMAYRDPKWDWRTFDWDQDVADLERRLGDDIEATNPDLSGLRAHAGKLIVYQGWMDPLNAQTLPAEYRAAAIARFARDQRISREAATTEVDAMLRLFMVPGMGHCAGGPGPSTIDPLAAMRAWVEDGRAPERLTATGVDGGKLIARPICAYPAVAHGTGACVRSARSGSAD